MRTSLRYVTPVLAAAGAASAILAAPTAAADPTDPTLPQCTSVGGDETVGTATTECATPGNVQINATAPDVPAYPYPWDDEFYGSALIMARRLWPPQPRWRRPPLAHILGPLRRPTVRIKNSLSDNAFGSAAACATIAARTDRSSRAQCTNTGPNTTLCQTNGSAQIVTSPPANNYSGTGASRSSGSAAGASAGEPGLATGRTVSANLTFLFDSPDRRWG